MTSTTQLEILENIRRTLRKIQRELQLKPEDSNLIDLVNHLDTHIQVLTRELWNIKNT